MTDLTTRIDESEDVRAAAFNRGWNDRLSDAQGIVEATPLTLDGPLAREFYQLGYDGCGEFWTDFWRRNPGAGARLSRAYQQHIRRKHAIAIADAQVQIKIAIRRAEEHAVDREICSLIYSVNETFGKEHGFEIPFYTREML